MQLTDLNRYGGIGANSLLVKIADCHILIDCGLNPKKAGREALPDFSPLADIDLDLIVLTHCHLDHLGALPVVMRDHVRAPVVMSVPSLALAERMLHNSANVMRRQAQEESIPGMPLYSHEEAEQCASRFVGLPFGHLKKFHGARDGIEIVLHPAGHVAGAAGVEIRHGRQRIFFTGDVMFEPQRTLPAADFPVGPFDIVVTETTRGATELRAAERRLAEVDRLIEAVNHTLDRGGSALIPVFALGRMQEILTIFAEARKQKKLRQCPVFCSGLGLDLVDYFDQISRKTGLVKFSRGVLKDLKVKKIPRNLTPGREPSEPGLYLLSSGMLVENTPSYLLASCLAGHHRNMIAFVGYCDPDTPGGHMLETRQGEDFLFESLDLNVKLTAQVERFELSGHADRNVLVDYALACDPRAVVLTHGDPPARQWFLDEFAVRRHTLKVLDPRPLETYEV